MGRFASHLELLQPGDQALQLSLLGGRQLGRQVCAQLRLQIPDLSLQRLRRPLERQHTVDAREPCYWSAAVASKWHA